MSNVRFPPSWWEFSRPLTLSRNRATGTKSLIIKKYGCLLLLPKQHFSCKERDILTTVYLDTKQNQNLQLVFFASNVKCEHIFYGHLSFLLLFSFLPFFRLFGRKQLEFVCLHISPLKCARSRRRQLAVKKIKDAEKEGLQITARTRPNVNIVDLLSTPFWIRSLAIKYAIVLGATSRVLRKGRK